MTVQNQSALLDIPVVAISAKYLVVPSSQPNTHKVAAPVYTTQNVSSAETNLSAAINSEPSIGTPSTVASSASSVDQATALLKAIWRSERKVHQICYLNRETKQFKNIPVQDINDAASKAFAKSDADHESYFAMAEYITPESRAAANVSGAYALWMDIDVGDTKAVAGKGYRTIEEAQAALKKFCKDNKIPEASHLVNSGGGLHVYWVTSKFIDRETWQKYAKMLKAVTKTVGFLADDTRTADIASVLRVPSTFNYKYTPPRLVTLLQSTDKYIDLDMMLAAIESAHDRLCVTESVANKKSSTTHEIVGTRNANIGTATAEMPATPLNIDNVKSALAAINPDCEREQWFKNCCALRSLNWVNGELIARAWSKGEYWTATNQQATKFDAQAFDIMWKSIKSDAGISIGTLFHFAKQAGWMPAGHSQVEGFKICEMVVIEPNGKTKKQADTGSESESETKQQSNSQVKTNPLDKYSLRGKTAELEKNALNEVYVLDGIALQGEITVFFAAPNTGKTAISLRLLVNGISEGGVDPNKVYYLNMDDSSQGVIAKNRIAEQYNFHMLTEGFEGFSALAFLPIVRGMIENEQAHGVVLILDTLKKFADVMDNTKTSIFTSVMRAFVMKGGTVIALAHTNKHANKDGKPQYGGVSSILADVDCAYTIAVTSVNDEVKVVAFENIKRRGNIAQSAVYSYSVGNNISYDDLLTSVQSIDDAQLDTMKRAEEMKSASETIDIVLGCIAEGINTKMELVDAVAKRAEMSKNAAIKFINKYAGADIARHKWNFTVGARGAKTYVALNPGAPARDSEMPIAD